LRREGVEYRVISIVTGISRTQVFNIICGKRRKDLNEIERKTDLSGVRRTIKALYKEILSIVKEKGG
jgi:hypothetical protein